MKTTIGALALAVLLVLACEKSRKVPVDAAPPILNPNHPEMKARAPDVFKVKFETTAGDFVVQAKREWAPHGVDRFYNLVRHGFYDGCRFFRVLPGFIVQWGMNGDPKLGKIWNQATFPDDPRREKNVRGTITFAKANFPNSRSTHLFVNYVDNSAKLDDQGFAPFGTIVEGMDVVDRINPKYGQAPDQGSIEEQGNAYLSKFFPGLDEIRKAYVVKE